MQSSTMSAHRQRAQVLLRTLARGQNLFPPPWIELLLLFWADLASDLVACCSSLFVALLLLMETEDEGDGVVLAEEEDLDPEDGVLAVVAAVNLDTTRVRARFSDLRRSFSAFSFCSCCAVAIERGVRVN